MVSTGDVKRVPEFIAASCVEVDGDRTVESEPEAMAEHIRGVRRVYPDLRITVERQIVEDQWVDDVRTQFLAEAMMLGAERGRIPRRRYGANENIFSPAASSLAED